MPDLKQDFQTAVGRIHHKDAAAYILKEFSSADELAAAVTNAVE